MWMAPFTAWGARLTIQEDTTNTASISPCLLWPMWPAASGYCCHGSPPWWTLKPWAKVNSPFRKLLWSGVLLQQWGKWQYRQTGGFPWFSRELANDSLFQSCGRPRHSLHPFHSQSFQHDLFPFRCHAVEDNRDGRREKWEWGYNQQLTLLSDWLLFTGRSNSKVSVYEKF